MALTLIVTRDVEDRYRGFLSSAMLEVAPGVYASPALTAGARNSIWAVLSDWHAQLNRGSLCLIYQDAKTDGGMSVQQLGLPPRRPIRLEGVLLMMRVST